MWQGIGFWGRAFWTLLEQQDVVDPCQGLKHPFPSLSVMPKCGKETKLCQTWKLLWFKKRAKTFWTRCFTICRILRVQNFDVLSHVVIFERLEKIDKKSPLVVGFSTYVRYYSRRCLGHFWHQTRVGHQLEWEPPPSAPENSSWPSTWVGASPSQPPKPRAAWCGIWSSRKTRVGHQLESIWGPFSFIFGLPWKLELATDLSWSQANLSRFGGAFSFILGGPGNSSLSPTWIELGSF